MIKQVLLSVQHHVSLERFGIQMALAMIIVFLNSNCLMINEKREFLREHYESYAKSIQGLALRLCFWPRKDICGFMDKACCKYKNAYLV